MERQWLAVFREKRGLTHKQVAQLTEIKRPYYTMIENGTRRPSVDVAKRIATVLKFKWTIFFNHDGNESLQ